jgi:CHAD domain-containing protein
MADGKWIEDLRPDMPVHVAAGKVLKVRLDVVRDALPPAVHEADRDVEHVHRLRVATRRADAALKIFRPNLPDKVFKSARKRLQRLRRAAGEARDWDVFLFDLIARQAVRPATERPGLDFLVGLAFAQRATAQPLLSAAAAKDGQPELDGNAAATANAVSAGANEPTLVQLARPLLASLLHRLEEATRGDLSDYAHLHQVRIAGKRLRYAMEVFAGCFAADFRVNVYPQVEEMQEILGRANDSHVAVGRLVDVRERLQKTAPEEWKRVKAGIEAVLRFHRLRLPTERRRFLAWWKRWGTATGAEFSRLLSLEAAIHVAE